MNQEFTSSSIRDVTQLEEILSEPNPAVIAALARVQGDILVLGIGGKMGPSLARMLRRASDAAGTPRRIFGVSRFSDPEQEPRLRAHQIETIRADLLDEKQ